MSLLRRTVLIPIGLALLVGCQSGQRAPSSKPVHSPRAAAEAQSTGRSAAPPQPEEPPRYSELYDEEIQEIFALAKRNRWEEAERRTRVLLRDKAPQDDAVQRLHEWVTKQRQLQREQALENKIREIDSQNSVFNPSIVDLLTEQKDRGLPPRKDLRDSVERIEATPYVPESYGRTIQRKGPLFDLNSREGRMFKVLENPVSVHLDNVPLESIIFNIGQAEGINFVADKSLPAFQQRLSVNADEVRLGEFLRYVSRNLNVHFQVGEDLIWIIDGSQTNLFEETRFYRLRKGFVVPAQFGPTQAVETRQITPQKVETVTTVREFTTFVTDGAPEMPSIEMAIREFFHGSKYMIDYERNLIVATGTPEQHEILERIVKEFDEPIQQVLIEARFITVSEAAFMQLGVTWETGRDPLGAGRVARDFTGLGGFEGPAVGLGLQETFTNILSRQNLSATLTALQQSGESQTLSAPRLTLINNRPATISDGKVQYYYEEYTVKQQVLERTSASTLVPQGKPQKLTSGVILDVVASIGGDGQNIMLALNPRVNQEVRLVTFASVQDRDETGRLVSSFDIRLPELRTQELATRVIVRSGQTVVMGGVLEREQRTFVESVPILGNLPLIGAAFRKRTEIDRPRYLLIFVTATLLSETGEFILYDDNEIP